MLNIGNKDHILMPNLSSLGQGISSFPGLVLPHVYWQHLFSSKCAAWMKEVFNHSGKDSIKMSLASTHAELES